MDLLNMFNMFFISDSGGEPFIEQAELEADGKEFANYDGVNGGGGCVVA